MQIFRIKDNIFSLFHPCGALLKVLKVLKVVTTIWRLHQRLVNRHQSFYDLLVAEAHLQDALAALGLALVGKRFLECLGYIFRFARAHDIAALYADA